MPVILSSGGRPMLGIGMVRIFHLLMRLSSGGMLIRRAMLGYQWRWPHSKLQLHPHHQPRLYVRHQSRMQGLQQHPSVSPLLSSSHGGMRSWMMSLEAPSLRKRLRGFY